MVSLWWTSCPYVRRRFHQNRSYRSHKIAWCCPWYHGSWGFRRLCGSDPERGASKLKTYSRSWKQKCTLDAKSFRLCRFSFRWCTSKSRTIGRTSRSLNFCSSWGSLIQQVIESRKSTTRLKRFGMRDDRRLHQWLRVVLKRSRESKHLPTL